MPTATIPDENTRTAAVASGQGPDRDVLQRQLMSGKEATVLTGAAAGPNTGPIDYIETRQIP
jgi:hypothetical protein